MVILFPPRLVSYDPTMTGFSSFSHALFRLSLGSAHCANACSALNRSSLSRTWLGLGGTGLEKFEIGTAYPDEAVPKTFNSTSTPLA